MSSQTIHLLGEVAMLLICGSAIVWVLWRWLKGSRSPETLVLRWILTAVALFWLYRCGMEGKSNMQAGNGAALFAVIEALIGGIFLAVMWVPLWTDFVSRKIGSLYDGGDDEAEPKPFYSIYNSKRSQGKYFEALAEVRRQLDRFPTDFEGQMHLAELQATHLNDLQGAGVTVQRFYNQPGHAPANIAFALNKLADWHLSLVKDRDGARAALEKIIELLPDTEMSLHASQRIAHLADTETLLAPQHRQRVVVKKGVENLGLLMTQDHLKAAEKDPAAIAQEFVKHLEQHPLDTDAREKLALVYANHYHRLDLALDQLEQLVQQPNRPAKQVVHWLNLMADLQVQENAGPDAVRATLQRIVDAYPGLPAAEKAQRRMDILKYEFNANTEKRQVRLGVYEQNIGLKGKA